MSFDAAKKAAEASGGSKSLVAALIPEILKSALKNTGGATLNHVAKGLGAYITFKDQPYAGQLILTQIKSEFDLNVLWSVLVGMGVDLLDIIPKTEKALGIKPGKLSLGKKN